MSFLEEKWREAFSSLVVVIAMGISLVLSPDNDYLQLYIMLLSIFVIVFLWGSLRGGLDVQSWRQIPFVIVQLALAPLAFVGSFAMIGGVIFLALGLVTWDHELKKTGILLLMGGAAPVVAMKVIYAIMNTRWMMKNR